MIIRRPARDERSRRRGREFAVQRGRCHPRAIFPGRENAYIGGETILEPLIVRSLVLEDARRVASPAPDGGPRAFIKSFGCQMNVYDAERMADIAAEQGYREAQGVEDADLIVLNTCHIRERASEKIYSELGKLRELKEERRRHGRRTTLVVAGCVAQAEGAEILRRQPAVDVVVGPQSYHRLPQLLREARDRPGVVAADFPAEDKFAQLPAPTPDEIARRGVAAFVTVQEGCDKFCSFCVVPYTRGAEASRPLGAILDEIARLAAAGVREVTLIGQNVNAYHGLDSWPRNRACRPDPRRRGRARDRPGALYDFAPQRHERGAHRRPSGGRSARAHLHLPVQSGSDRVLESMNRRHRVDDYLDIVARVRAARADIAFSSDFIVGYPGETDADFGETLALVSAVGFASAYAFKYSARPGTPAAETLSQIDEATKAGRLAQLQALSRANGRLSTARPSDGASRFCSRSPAGARVRSSAARPICSRCSPKGRHR